VAVRSVASMNIIRHISKIKSSSSVTCKCSKSDLMLCGSDGGHGYQGNQDYVDIEVDAAVEDNFIEDDDDQQKISSDGDGEDLDDNL
jgi:hypothetical protein